MATAKMATIIGALTPWSAYVFLLGRAIDVPQIETGALMVSDKTKLRTEPATRAEAKCEGR